MVLGFLAKCELLGVISWLGVTDGVDTNGTRDVGSSGIWLLNEGGYEFENGMVLKMMLKIVTIEAGELGVRKKKDFPLIFGFYT